MEHRRPSTLQLALSLVAVATLSAAQQSAPPGDLARKQSQRSNAQTKSRRVLTNDDFAAAGHSSEAGVPEIPGLVKCGRDLNCFLEALDRSAPAAVTRNETAEQANAVVTAASTWWVANFAAEKCTVSFRVEAFKAEVNEKVVQDKPKAVRDAIEARIAESNKDFEQIRGKTNTCTMSRKDFKVVMMSRSLSLMSLGPATHMGKDCSGSMFQPLPSPSPNDKK